MLSIVLSTSVVPLGELTIDHPTCAVEAEAALGRPELLLLSRAGAFEVGAAGCWLGSTELPSELAGLGICDPNGIPLSRGSLAGAAALKGSLCALREFPS